MVGVSEYVKLTVCRNVQPAGPHEFMAALLIFDVREYFFAESGCRDVCGTFFSVHPINMKQDFADTSSYLLFLSAIAIALFFFDDITEKEDDTTTPIVRLVHSTLQMFVNAACAAALIMLCVDMFLLTRSDQFFRRREYYAEAFLLLAWIFCIIDLYFFTLSPFFDDEQKISAGARFAAEFVPLCLTSVLICACVFRQISVGGADHHG